MKVKISKSILIIMFILFIIIIDQIIKLYVINNIYNTSIVLINGFLSLTYVENTGGAYGIGSSNTIIFIIANIIIIGMLVKFLLEKKELITKVSLSLIIAGGIGNLIDRIFRGKVIDYIDISQLFKYPVFNFADTCIVLGIIFIIINLIIIYRRNK